MMKMSYFKPALIVVLGMAVIALSNQAVARTMIKDTRHNLSNWSPYQTSVKGDTSQVCIFCHAPHNANSTQAPLWNHVDTETTFGMASSTHLQPDGTYMDTAISGISRKCLSCHDGTIAVGATSTMGTPITMTGNNVDADGKLSTSAPGYIGSDLSSGHILAFKYDSTLVTYLNSFGANGYYSPSNVPVEMLDKEKKMQCHTCHDPHNDWCNDPNTSIGKDPLWRLACDGTGKNISVCQKCHQNSFKYYTYPF